MAGTWIQILGGVFVETVITSPLIEFSLVAPDLTSPLPPGCPNAETFLVWKVAHIFRSLANTLTTLDTYYSTKPTISHDIHPAPFFTTFVSRLDNRTYTVRYTKRFETATSPRTTFFADATSSDADAGHEVRMPVVIKFTDQYNKEAHGATAKEIAVPLLFCAWDVVVGRYIVVTKFVQSSDPPVLSRDGYGRLQTGLKKLHNENLVFGDLRAANIIVNGGLPYLIDFDWCGEAGKARYPHNLSSNAGFSEDAGGKLITVEDDEKMLAKYIKEFPPS